MYNIALINHKELSQSDYAKKLENKKNQIHLFDVTDIPEQVDTVDAIIIGHSDSVDETAQTCAAIIKVREHSQKFIWVLSKQSTKLNRMLYLQLGCDGVFDERIDSEEFSLFVNSVLERRGLTKPFSQSAGLSFTNQSEKFQLNAQNLSITIAGKGEVGLTKQQFKILSLLYARKGEAVSYEELFQNNWKGEESDKQYRIANLIFHLRKKLECPSNQSIYIKTVRSKGYMLSI